MSYFKRIPKIIGYPLIAGLVIGLVIWLTYAFAANIDATNKWSYGENVGWQNWAPTDGNGVTIESTGLTGYLWAENIGWIKLDYDGTAVAANTSATDWGVTNDGSGNLAGYAWGENVGWINFHPTDSQVTIDSSGNFSGYAWGENIGWLKFTPDTNNYIGVKALDDFTITDASPAGEAVVNMAETITITAKKPWLGSGNTDTAYSPATTVLVEPTGSYTPNPISLSAANFTSGVATTNVTWTTVGIYNVVATDQSNTNITGTSSPINVAADTTAPTVSNVTSTKTNGAYKAGEAIDITVTFTEVVNVVTTGGTPYITLETGTTDRNVSYTSGTGTATLTFAYTVQAGDTAGDLDYVATDSLALNGGTIKDAAGNNATLILVAPGAAGSLGDSKALVIDTTAPTISATAPATNAYIKTSTVSYTLSEAAASSTNTKITFTQTGGTADASSPHVGQLQGTALDTGAHTNLVLETGANSCVAWTALVNGSIYTVTFNAVDAAGNAATTITNTNVTNDTTAPAAFTTGAVITTGAPVVAGYWNESNTGINVTVPIANDATLTDGTVQIEAKVNSGAYANIANAGTILVTELNGTHTVAITATQLEALTGFADDVVITFNAKITDKAGNTTEGTASVTTITVNQTDAALSGAVSVASNNTVTTLAKVGNTVTYSITYTKPVTASVISASTANNITAAVTTDAHASASASDTIVFTVAAGNTGAITPNNINFSITDVAGNVATITSLGTISGSVTADTTAPGTASVTDPADFNDATKPSSFGGSCADNTGGTGLNANSSAFYIRKVVSATSYYWNGTDWNSTTAQWLATTHNATTSDTSATWSSNVTLPSWTPGAYYAKLKALDKAGNTFDGSEITFNYIITLSVSVSPGTWAKGSVTESNTYSTFNSSLAGYITATNNGPDTEDLEIKASSSGGCSIGSTAGADTARIGQGQATGASAPYTAPASYTALSGSDISLVDSLASSGEYKFDLELKAPTTTTYGGVPQTITVTVTATAP